MQPEIGCFYKLSADVVSLFTVCRNPKKQEVQRPPVCKAELKRSLCFLSECGESSLVIDGEIGQHFAVDLDPGLFQAVHKAAVIDTADLRLGRNTGDPQAAEIAFSRLTADIRIFQRLHNRLVGSSEMG